MQERPKHASVDDFINSFSGEVKTRLEKMRELIKKEVPEAVEMISYNIPAYKFKNKWLAYLAGYPKHVSIAFPPTSGFYEQFPELADFKYSKSTIQFPLTKALPEKLIIKMIKVRKKICEEMAGTGYKK